MWLALTKALKLLVIAYTTDDATPLYIPQPTEHTEHVIRIYCDLYYL